MGISPKLFLEVVIKRKSNSWGSAIIKIDCLKRHQVHVWLPQRKQCTIQYIVMTTIEFSLDNTEEKFANLSGNWLPINIKRSIGLKIALVKFSNPKVYTAWPLSLSVPLFSFAKVLCMLHLSRTLSKNQHTAMNRLQFLSWIIPHDHHSCFVYVHWNFFKIIEPINYICSFSSIWHYIKGNI